MFVARGNTDITLVKNPAACTREIVINRQREWNWVRVSAKRVWKNVSACAISPKILKRYSSLKYLWQSCIQSCSRMSRRHWHRGEYIVTFKVHEPNLLIIYRKQQIMLSCLLIWKSSTYLACEASFGVCFVNTSFCEWKTEFQIRRNIQKVNISEKRYGYKARPGNTN